MKSCIFSYLVTEKDVEISELQQKHSFGQYTVLTDFETPYDSFVDEKSECAIFGYAVNVHNGKSENIAKEAVSCCSCVLDLIEFEKSLGGKYVIFYRLGDEYFALGDATCSIPIFYNTEGEFCCSGNLHTIVDYRGYKESEELSEIRNSGDISQAMPFDITQYREVLQILPNHFLSFNKRKAIRFVNFNKLQPEITADEAAERTSGMIDVLSDYYKNRFNIYCPITSGRDSRVVLAFLADKNYPVRCYTIRHPEHNENAQDLVIPKTICEKMEYPYEQICDIEVSEDLRKEADSLLGKNNYSPRTLRIANTIKQHYGNGAVINGDIIGQVGKCSLHRDIPSCFATPGYFRCKLHNYSKAAKEQLKLWIADVRKSSETVNLFDLFSIEQRLGRWAAQGNLIYNSIGQVYLNIFNSRSIIYPWTLVSRKNRKNSDIHIKLIQKKLPNLMAVPFETDENFIFRLSKASGFTYLCSSYAKYCIESRKFKRRQGYEKIDNHSR